MALSILPEGLLVNLLPSKVAAMDQRGLLHAVVSAFQDRVEDIRAYVAQVEGVIDPRSGFPTTGRSILEDYTDTYGKPITRSMLAYNVESDLVAKAILDGSASNSDAINWVSISLGIPLDDIDRVYVGDDPFKAISESMSGYLAKTIGATLPTSDPSDSRVKDILSSHFLRLTVKGTVSSIETAGRLIGFDAVIVTPLWGRLSPRSPLDIGEQDNDVDFKVEPDANPTIETTDTYDPLDYRDGPFFLWSFEFSQNLYSNFIGQVNGTNPFISLTIGGQTSINFRGEYNATSSYSQGDVVTLDSKSYIATAPTTVSPLSWPWSEFSVPDAGEYTLSDGGPNKKAFVDLGHGLVAYGLSQGESFNGLKITVDSTGSGLVSISVNDRLSSVKYRTSHFNLSLAVREAEVIANATVSTPRKVDTVWLANLASEANSLISACKPSTRSTRHVGVGVLYDDSVGYAAYIHDVSAFTDSGPTSGSVSGPELPRAVSAIITDGITEIEMTGESVTPGSVAFSSVQPYGLVSLSVNSDTGAFTGSRPAGFPSGSQVKVRWTPDGSEVIRSTPGIGSNVAYLSRPEDVVIETESGGAVPSRIVDHDSFVQPLENFQVEAGGSSRVTTLRDQSGVNRVVYAIGSTQFPFRLKAVEVDPTSTPVRAIAYNASGKVYAGIVHGQVVADPDHFYSHEFKDGLVAWIPLNHHPDDDLAVKDVFELVNCSASKVYPSSRIFDSSRGWVTRLDSSSISRSGLEISQTLTLTFWLRIHNETNTTNVLSYGPLQIDVNNDVLDFYWRVGGVKTFIASKTLTRNSFDFVCVRRSFGSIGVSLNTVESVATGSYDDVEDDNLVLSSTGRVIDFQDLRAWSVLKSASAIVKISAPSIQTLILPSELTPITVIGSGDQWYLKALSSGFIVTGLKTGSTLIRVNTFGTDGRADDSVTSEFMPEISEQPELLVGVSNYDVLGRFIGEPKLKLTGMSGGNQPTTRYLGNAVHPTAAVNRPLISPRSGLMSGINVVWMADTATGSIRTVSAPYSSDGGVTSTVSTGILDVWPNKMDSVNPIFDQAWIKGTDGVYEVTVVGSKDSPTLEAHSVQVEREFPSGAVTQISDPIDNKVLSVTNGTVFKSSTVSPVTLAPTYLYRNKYPVADFSGMNGWQTNDLSVELDGSPALESSGSLVWLVPESLTPGHYRITLTSHNHGHIHSNFSGFDVEVGIGSFISFPLVLSATGAAVSHDFVVDGIESGPWNSTVGWSGLLDDPAHGVSFSLVVSRVVIERVQSQVYRVDGLTLVELPTTAAAYTLPSSLPPGAWISKVANSGLHGSEFIHESRVYELLDGVESDDAASSLLTGSTIDRVSTVILSKDYAEPEPPSNPPSATTPVVTLVSSNVS